MRKYDIQVKGNSIGGRQGYAYILNSGEFAVLRADLDKNQEYDDFKTYSGVRLAWNYRGHELLKDCTLAWSGENGRDVWELKNYGSCLSASFGLSDVLEMIESANTPIVRKGDIVAIARYSKEWASISLFKCARIDIHCSTSAVFEPLSDDEMNEIVARANKWLNG